MCICLIASSSKYGIIILNNRDEYILRPTSRPHWWTHQPSGQQVLSSRDLLRQERGTWMGVSRQGRLAVLTNYREVIEDTEHPTYGVRSRGAMVTAWLGAPEEETLEQFVTKMLDARAVKGVGGFSLICGDLRPRNGDGEKCIEPLAIISNRSEAIDGVPRIAGGKDKVWGLSNTVYQDPPTWPKIIEGKRLLSEVLRDAEQKDVSPESLMDLLFTRVLDHDTLPARTAGLSHEEYLNHLKESIFIPAISDADRKKDMEEARAKGRLQPAFEEIEDESREVRAQSQGANPKIFEKGDYGCQRQTIVLVDWNGQVTYKERALWDAHGNPIERGKGDVTVTYDIEGWH